MGVTVAEAEGQESEVVMDVDPDFSLESWEASGFNSFLMELDEKDGPVKGCAGWEVEVKVRPGVKGEGATKPKVTTCGECGRGCRCCAE